jgi:phosphomevalonate kinase
MIVDVGTHLNLFDFLRLLALAGKVGLFLGLIFKLANIQEFADRRISIGGDFDQIEADFGGLCYRFFGI